MRRELESIDIPGESEARARTWSVLSTAFAERQPVERPSRRMRLALAVAILVAALAAVFSSPGRAVLDEIREVVGVERAQPALFSLPSPGRLLVASDAGVWVVQQDGSKRLLGEYREASWSPFGRFVVAARENELAALEPDGDVRWTLARPGVRSPRWAGTETDTRIAYVDRTGLRIVAGDGTGDRLLVPGFRGRLAWNPTEPVLAYASATELRVRDLVSGRLLWRRPGTNPGRLEWSADGRVLLVAGRSTVVLYTRQGGARYELGPGAAPTTAAALAPTGKRLAFASEAGAASQLWVVPRVRPDASAARRLFTGTGRFDHVSWTPDERWILVSWPAADQLLFIRSNGGGIRAASAIAEQFRSRTFPRIEGWCCGP